MQTQNIRSILNLPIPTIEEKATASLTLFVPTEKQIWNEDSFQSKSNNSPFIGKELTGKVIGIIHKNNLVLN